MDDLNREETPLSRKDTPPREEHRYLRNDQLQFYFDCCTFLNMKKMDLNNATYPLLKPDDVFIGYTREHALLLQALADTFAHLPYLRIVSIYSNDNNSNIYIYIFYQYIYILAIYIYIYIFYKFKFDSM